MNKEHFDTESLNRFITELEEKGFEQVPDRPGTWRGNIHPAFAGLTKATRMEIIIRPGWPYHFPLLLVEGVNTSHSTPEGLICLWRDGDASMVWKTLDGFYDRIADWCQQAEQGWKNQNLTQDAYLNYLRKQRSVAIFDLNALQVEPRKRGDLHGTPNYRGTAITISTGKATAPNHIPGIWLHAEALTGPPPRNLFEVPRHLSRSQAGKLETCLKKLSQSHNLPWNRYFIILFCWTHEGQPNALALLCHNAKGKPEAYAMMPGPADQENLMLRAGPDALLLKDKKVVIFGAGALGGQTALTIAQSGIRELDIVDHDVVLPGNVARHIAGHGQTGTLKVEAVKTTLADHAPWTKVNPYPEYIRTPQDIRRRIQDADLIIDASGDAILKTTLVEIATQDNMPLVSGSLFLGGAVSRVQRQVHFTDTPILDREEHTYPLIPAGNPGEEFIIPEAGCSAPVNNAPPTSALACAARIAQVAIDALTSRFQYGDEIIDVYRPIGSHPFDRVGQLSTPPPSAQR